MKLVAKIKATRFLGALNHPFIGKVYPVVGIDYDCHSCMIDLTEGDVKESWLPCNLDDVDVLLSTGMLDKNGREILVGDEIRYYNGGTSRVLSDGECFFVHGYANIAKPLTPELAKTLEVV